MGFKYKSNILDVCLILFTITLCIVYARKQLQIQDLMLLEQKAKIELLSKINISDYDLDEIETIVDTLRFPKSKPDIINIPWSTTYLLVPYNTDILELRQFTELYPGIRVVIMQEEEQKKITDQFLGRSRSKF